MPPTDADTGDHAAAGHEPWCVRDCPGLVTGVHTSSPVRATPTGAELTGVTVRLERLDAPEPVAVLAIDFTQDGQVATYLLPLDQAEALHRAVATALRIPTRA